MAEVSGVELYLRYERPVLIRLGILKQPIRISPQNIIMIITPLCAARHFIVHEKRVTAIPAAPANSFHHFLKTVINESLTLESVYHLCDQPPGALFCINSNLNGITGYPSPDDTCGDLFPLLPDLHIRAPRRHSLLVQRRWRFPGTHSIPYRRPILY